MKTEFWATGYASKTTYWESVQGKHGKGDFSSLNKTGNIMFYPDNQNPFYRCCMPVEDFIFDRNTSIKSTNS